MTGEDSRSGWSGTTGGESGHGLRETTK